MELAYDKQEELMPSEQPQSSENPSSLDKAADKLEAGIEQAFAKFSSTNWGGLWNSVKQQGEAALKETRKEVEAALKKAGTNGADVNTSNENKTSSSGSPSHDETQTTPTGSNSNLASSTATVTPVESDKNDKATNSSTMLAALTERAQVYIDELDRDLEKMENAAGSYLMQLGKDMKTLLKDAVTVTEPGTSSQSTSVGGSESGEDAPAELLFNVPEGVRNQIYSTRLDAQLHALHTSKEPFMTTIDEPDYQKFEKSFDVAGHTDEIASDLEKHPMLRKLMESLIPDPVPYETFWTKYYYMRKQISEQEARRKLLLQQAAASAEQDVNWDDDDDDDDDDDEVEGADPRREPTNISTDTTRAPDSSRPSSESSYDLISKNESGLNLANKSIPPPTKEEDSDDDWE